MRITVLALLFAAHAHADPVPTWSDDVAVAYPKELRAFHAGSPQSDAPTVIPLPAPLTRPPVWSKRHALYLVLRGGSVAVVTDDKIHAIAIPVAGYDDVLRAGDGGEMWLERCTPRNHACEIMRFRIDTPMVKRDPRSFWFTATRRGAPWPAPPATVSMVDSVAISGKLTYTEPPIQVTPTQRLVAYDVTEIDNDHGYTSTKRLGRGYQLDGTPSKATIGDGGLYAFTDAGSWTVGADGKIIQRLPHAMFVSFGDSSGSQWQDEYRP